MTRRCLRAALIAVLLGLTTACVGMPTSGRVVDAGPAATTTDAPGIAIDPRPPVPGATAAEIVQGFLDAMLATPMQTRTAQRFLAADARAGWDPAQQTITYGEKGAPQAGGDQVVVELEDAHRLDSRGAWRGALSPEASSLTFRMVREAGEWRIAAAPDALIVPQSWFESRFAQASLYFFDAAGKVLVPEPVFVPRGSQLATALVRGLVQGPGPELAGVSRSYLPAGLQEGLSVPVSASGIADVALTGGHGDAAQLGPQVLSQLTAQLAWTLRQEPSIHTVRLSIDGRDVQLPNGRSEFSVDEGPEYDPAGYQTSPQLFGIADGLLVAGATEEPERLRPVQGPFGATRVGLRSVAVDLAGRQAAGVTTAGTVLLAPVQATGGITRIGRGGDLLRPAWDVAGRLWLVDRAGGGAEVSYVRKGHRRVVTVPGVTGADVRRFLVSRDGTRLVAVVHRDGGDHVLVSRLRGTDDGAIVAGNPAVMVSDPGVDLDQGPDRITDLAWRTPTTLLVLHRLAGSSQLRTIAVDGAPSGFPVTTLTLGEQADSVISSPEPTQGVWLLAGGRLIGVSGDARDANLTAAGGPVIQLGFVG